MVASAGGLINAPKSDLDLAVRTPEHEGRIFKVGQQPSTARAQAFAQEIGASVGKPVHMEMRDDKLIVKVAKPRRKQRYMLERLVAGITPENRHSELEWGPPVGNEV
jgi:antitoxin MazE